MLTKQRQLELMVGIFMVLGILAFVYLALKVSGLTNYTSSQTYSVTAAFTDVGDLKARAPVAIGGVAIGRVVGITLNPKSYKAIVTMDIKQGYEIPTDSTANIFTAGLLGANYISITPGFENQYLKEGGKITNTNPALILQNLIGKLMFNLNSKKGK